MSPQESPGKIKNKIKIISFTLLPIYYFLFYEYYFFNRCLEEGAEEFFLKPVRLSDVNKLRPHMMKTKNNNIIIEKMENDEEEEDDDDSSPSTSTSGIHHLQTTQSLNNNNNGNSKRKSMDEAGLPLDITRPRYNGGLTVLSN